MIFDPILRRLGYVKAVQTVPRDTLSPGAQLITGSRREVPRRGTRDLLGAYRESPVLQAVVKKISFACASSEWHALARHESGETRLDDHMALRMMNAGTPFMSGFHARMVTQMHMELVGESFEVLERNRLGAPVMKWPLPPHWVAATPTPVRPFFEINPEYGHEAVRIPMEDVLWRRDPDPERPYGRGSGVGYSLGDELNADEYAAKHLAMTLANRARPDLIISGTHENALTVDDVERMRSVWSDRFGGADKAGKPMFASVPINVHDLTPTFRELDLTSLREYERDILILAFGMPPEMIGQVNESKRSTIEAAEFLFTKHVVRPRLTMAAADYNTQLAPQYDERLRLWFDDPVDEDRDFLQAAMAAQPWAYSWDEHRVAGGFEELPDGRGKVYPMPFSMQLSENPAGGFSFDEEESKAPRHKIAKMSGDGIEDAAGSVDDSIFRAIFLTALTETVAAFGEDALERIGFDIAFDLFDPAVQRFIETNAMERSKLVGDVTRASLRKTLGEGVAAGESTDKLVSRIRETITGASQRRARVISRTEIVRASNYATTEAHKQAGVDTREWLATADDKVRDSHRELDGKRVGMEQRFEVNGRSAMYPGDFGVPEEDINCRCAVVPIVDFSGDSEQRAALWRKFDNGRRRHENALASRAMEAFRAQERAVVEAVRRGSVQG